MTEPEPDEPEAPTTVWVPTEPGASGFGLAGWVQVPAENAAMWDSRCWSRQPPR